MSLYLARVKGDEDPVARRSPTPIKVDRIQSLDALPEVKYLYAVADHGGKDPRAEVARRVDRKASLRTERHADSEEREEQRDRDEPWRGRAVPLVGDGEDDDDEQERADELSQTELQVSNLVNLSGFALTRDDRKLICTLKVSEE